MIQLKSACGIIDFSISCDQSVYVPDQMSRHGAANISNKRDEIQVFVFLTVALHDCGKRLGLNWTQVSI